MNIIVLIIMLMFVVTVSLAYAGIRYVDWMFAYGTAREWSSGVLLSVMLAPFIVGLVLFIAWAPT